FPAHREGARHVRPSRQPRHSAGLVGGELRPEMVFGVGSRCKRSCRAGTSLVERWSRLELWLGCPLEGWIVDRALHGLKPSGGPTVVGLVAHNQLDAVPDERSKLGTLEDMLVENGADSDRGHEKTL